jgi:hypothetical protein
LRSGFLAIALPVASLWASRSAAAIICATTAFFHPNLRWRGLTGLGQAAIAEGRSGEAEQIFRAALDVARTIGQEELCMRSERGRLEGVRLKA